MPVDALARDLAEAPWHLSSREQTILESALESLAGAKVSVGHVYYDYTPANLMFENDQLSLVDPPDVLRQGVLLWDFSCFRSSMRRHLWRFSLRRPFDRRRAMIKDAIALFQRSYVASFDKLYPELAFVRNGDVAFRTAAHCGVTNDAEGEGRSGAPEDADRPPPVTRQFSSQPNFAAFAGNRKAVALLATGPRAALITAFSDNEIEKISRSLAADSRRVAL